MSSLPQRLKEQRVSLKLTQQEFAETCGVKRRAQAAYESGERTPDADYLIRAAAKGADLKYLLTGVRASAAEQEMLCLLSFVRELGSQLKVPAEVVERCLASAASVDSVRPDAFGRDRAIKEVAAELLKRSERLNSKEIELTIDLYVLQDVIREQESAWFRMGKVPSPIEKSHRFSALYADASRSGAINTDLIEGWASADRRASKKAG